MSRYFSWCSLLSTRLRLGKILLLKDFPLHSCSTLLHVLATPIYYCWGFTLLLLTPVVGFLHAPKLLCILLYSIFFAGQTTRLLTESRSPKFQASGRLFPLRIPPPPPLARWVYIGWTSRQRSPIGGQCPDKLLGRVAQQSTAHACMDPRLHSRQLACRPYCN